MIRGFISTIAASTALLAATPARAELTLCNRTSYRMEAATGLEKRANVATRGWFRLDPGECRQVLEGPLDADMVYVHARTPSRTRILAPPSRKTGKPSSASVPAISISPMLVVARRASRRAERTGGQSRGSIR